MEKVERYRERILILKEDRHAKKAMVSCSFVFLRLSFLTSVDRLRHSFAAGKLLSGGLDFVTLE